MGNYVILATGGTGLLASELRNHIDATWLSSSDMDITNPKQVWATLLEARPRIILHMAAYTNVAGAEQNKAECWKVNAIGTANIVHAAKFIGAKVVYISSDYVFDGQDGAYNPDSTPNPLNYYALSKVAGEMAVMSYKNSLIIRTSFKPSTCPHHFVFRDMYTSADYVDVIAPMLPTLIQGYSGISHVGTERKSLYDLFIQRNPHIIAGIRDVARHVNLPRDVSFGANPHMDWEDLWTP